ncbi:MAG: UDP-N-acetylmuramoyl-L-alanyl-D-glutamate--2,6-diaminopimelate ligase [Bacteroidota bacterium]
MKMKKIHISSIENAVGVVRRHVGECCWFDGLYFDSRKVQGDAVFVAVSGTLTDGHEFIPAAIENGAKMIVCEMLPTDLQSGINYFQVSDSAAALAYLASLFYGHPSQQIKLVGITGTNGKTTTATLLYRMMENLGYKAGLLSTVRNYIHETEVPATHTTPDPVQINALLADMLEAGCEYCFMEVSSHAVEQKRIDGLHFDGAVFTNITHDHLDYHKTFANYINAKKAFFDQLDQDAFALFNSDDKNAAVMAQNTKASKKTYSLRKMSDFRLRIEEKHFEGMQLFINDKEVWTPLIGEYNACNLLAVYAVAVLMGISENDSLQALSELKPVEGRLEAIRSESGKTAIVDYAHTPDALKNVLSTLFEFKQQGKALICVFGAGGDRDVNKRPEMGRIAALYSTKLILTSDNPRSEEPEDIMKHIQKGIPVEKQAEVLKISNRKEAIKVAWSLAQAGDLILVAGKGHETYQEIHGVKHHFDDREVIYELINN